MEQRELESSSRWFSGIGCVFSDDFAQKHVGAVRMKQLDLSGAYVWRFDRPTSCTFVTFGAGGTWTFDLPITKQYTVSRTEAEMSRMSKFVMAIDPAGKYISRTWNYHLDLKDGGCRQMRRPTDEEIAQLQLDYREDRRQTLTGAFKPMRQEAVVGERMARELRALDRRRLRDANILPPIERRGEVVIKALRDGPRRILRPGKRKLDTYRSDTDEEEPRPWNDILDLPSYGVNEEADITDEDKEDSPQADEEDLDDSPPTKRARSCSTRSSVSANKGPGKILERVLRAMRARPRQSPQQQ